MSAHVHRVAPVMAEDDALLSTFAAPSQAARVFAGKLTFLLRADDTPLAVLVPGGIARDAGLAMYHAIRTRITESDNRGAASGMRNTISMHKDGTPSKNNRTVRAVQSSIAGFFDRYPRIPYCRQTAFNIQHPQAYRACLPALQQASQALQRHLPARYAAQAQVVNQTHPDFVIPGTVFTTLTLNRNFRTAYHRDAGDLPDGFGVMTCYRAGRYDGGVLVFPRYGVGVSMDSFDVLLFDPHELHGNTAIRPRTAQWERITCVHYYRKGMHYCGSAAQELALARAGNRKTTVRPKAP